VTGDCAGPADPPRQRGRRRSIPVEDVAEIVRSWPTPNGYGPYIADRWGVPLGTARRWIYEARLAGLLAPGARDRPCRTCNGTGVTRWWHGNGPDPNTTNTTTSASTSTEEM
jgi:hypothetical protein